MLDFFTIRSDFDDKAELIYDYLNEVGDAANLLI